MRNKTVVSMSIYNMMLDKLYCAEQKLKAIDKITKIAMVSCNCIDICACNNVRIRQFEKIRDVLNND